MYCVMLRFQVAAHLPRNTPATLEIVHLGENKVYLSGYISVVSVNPQNMFDTDVSRQIGFHTPPPKKKCFRYAPA